MTPNQKAALERLIDLGCGNTGQCRKVADFLLAWWNAAECGGFDLTEMWSVDDSIALDMLEVCRLIADCNSYPETLGYKAEFETIIKQWRPEFAWWESLTEAQRAAWQRRSKPFTPAEAYQEWREEERRRERPNEHE
jgi:hypothetical protein